MAKDPAFLFYPGDWLGGTMGMSFEEKGAYLDLLIFQFNKGRFTEKQAMIFLRSKDIWEALRSKFTEKDGLFWNDRLEVEKGKRSSFVESRRQARSKADEDKVRIYIVRDNVRLTYKIGSSVNPARRYNELMYQENPAIGEDAPGERDLILIWYSEFIQRSIEKVIHSQFITKNIKGEWFALSDEDIILITSTYEGTYVNRTENENENRNENTDKNKNRNRKPRTKKNVEEMGIWERCVKVWFEFYESKFKEKPSFAGRDPASLKKLLELVSQRVIGKNFEWKAETCEDHFIKFLQRAHTDQWLSQNFLIQNLCSQFDKIIVNGKNGKINGKEPTGGNVDVASAFEKIDRMFDKT
jgi:hypothetical protein